MYVESCMQDVSGKRPTKSDKMMSGGILAKVVCFYISRGEMLVLRGD